MRNPFYPSLITLLLYYKLTSCLYLISIISFHTFRSSARSALLLSPTSASSLTASSAVSVILLNVSAGDTTSSSSVSKLSELPRLLLSTPPRLLLLRSRLKLPKRLSLNSRLSTLSSPSMVTKVRSSTLVS